MKPKIIYCDCGTRNPRIVQKFELNPSLERYLKGEPQTFDRPNPEVIEKLKEELNA